MCVCVNASAIAESLPTPQGGGGGGDGRGQGATDEPSVVCVEGLISRMREDFPGRQGLDADAELLRRFALDDREHRMRLNKQRQGSDGTPGGDEGKRREEEVAARRLDRKRQLMRRSISGGIARSSRSRGPSRASTSSPAASLF